MEDLPSSHVRSDDGGTGPGAVDLVRMAADVDTAWVNRVAARVDGYVLRLVVQENTSPWHHHPGGDELFVVMTGRYAVDLTDRSVVLAPGQAFTVPRMITHRTRALERSVVLCFEAATNDVRGSRGDAEPEAPPDDVTSR